MALLNGQKWTALPAALSGYGFGAGLAVSADGQTIYVGASQIRFSNDGGETWSNRSGAIDVINSPVLATSADGSFVVAVVNQERTWISSNYGVTWTAALPKGQWQRLGMSSTGQYIAVTNTGGFLYVSRDFGASFTKTSVAQVIEGQDIMSDVAMSADGSKVIVSTKSWTGIGKVFLSTNFGATFSSIPTANLPISDWQNVDISGDGMTLLASVNSNIIWISRNGGSTWSLSPVTSSAGLTSASKVESSSISYDGSKIIIGLTASIVISTDFGLTWSTRAGAPNVTFYTAATSQDGYIIFANGGGTLYRSLPSTAWYDFGTVTIMGGAACPTDTGTFTSVSAQSVVLIIDTSTVANDLPTYYYFTETNTALWGANYDYGAKQNIDCSYSSMLGSVSLTRGPFIASAGTTYSETSTIGANTDFIQYVGNLNQGGDGITTYALDNACGNLNVPHLNVANSCDFTDAAKQKDWPTLATGGTLVWRTGVTSAPTSLVRTGTFSTSSTPGVAFVVVKALKSKINAAPINTSWVSTETFTVTTA
jgi:hypothetical protein